MREDGRVTGPRRVVRGLAGYKQALRFRHFRRLWLAAVASRAGDAVYFVALPLYVYGLTGSPEAVALLVITEGGALVVGGLLAQLLVDHVAPRRVLVAADVGRMLAVLGLAVAPSFALALCVAAALAVGTSLFSPVSAALTPRLVDEPSLPSANALLWTAGVALQLVAAPLGGLLVTAVSARAAFGLDALSFAASAAILAGLPHTPTLTVGTSPWRQLPEVVRAVHELPILARLLIVQALAALAIGATSALLVVLAERAYGLNGTGYGAWLGVIGAGALIGPIVVPALTRLPPTYVMTGAYIVRGAGDVGLAALGNAVVGGGLLAVYGLSTSSGTVAFQTLVQTEIPETLRGRAFALLDVTWQSGRLISIALGGAVASGLGIRPVFFAGGSMLVLAGIVGVVVVGLRPSNPKGRVAS